MLHIIRLHDHPLLGHPQAHIPIQSLLADPLSLHLDHPPYHLGLHPSTNLHHDLSNKYHHINSLGLNRVCS